MIKKIYILWYQGFTNAPMVVKKCVQSWILHNPNWKIIKLDETNIEEYIHLDDYIDRKNKNISLAHLSDIIRIALLDKYGGIWVDSTTFCRIPLNNWINKCTENGFFAFEKPGPDRLLSNWFLYSEPNHYITKTWLNEIINYWKINTKVHTYFAHHYLFGNLYNSDAEFKKLWDKTTKINASGPHLLVGKFLKPLDNNVKKHIDKKIIPLYKLTYKYDQVKYNENTNLAYLLSTIKD